MNEASYSSNTWQGSLSLPDNYDIIYVTSTVSSHTVICEIFKEFIPDSGTKKITPWGTNSNNYPYNLPVITITDGAITQIQNIASSTVSGTVSVYAK